MDNKEVLATLKAASLYLNRLNVLEADLETAVKQINNTFEETKKSIQQTFSNLKDTLLSILDKREVFLLDEARKIKKEGLTPLEECRSVVLGKVETTNNLINLGNKMLNGNLGNLANFIKDASLLGSLPEVPELKEVPYISFHHDPTAKNELIGVVSHFGEVYRIAPVQIRELKEKPGAIFIEWQSVENEDRMTDIQEFRLQKAFGNVDQEKHLIVNFTDCYNGLDTQFLVKDLQKDQPYSFRVCCKFEGTMEWSPWSLSQVFSTSLKPFSWKTHKDYLLLNENKIAKPIKNIPDILYSDGPQFCVGHSVEFTFLEVDLSDAILGLVVQDLPTSLSNLRTAQDYSFLINSHGKIFIDGTEKSTKLSDFTKGLKVCFTCDLINNQKVRVNIDSNEKRVTYDWSIDPHSKMYFVSQFFSANWKIMVE